MTLNGVMAIIFRYFSEFGSFRAHCIKVVEDIPKLSATDISFTMIWCREPLHRRTKRKRGNQI